MRAFCANLGASILLGFIMTSIYYLWGRYVQPHGPNAVSAIDVFFWTSSGAVIAYQSVRK